MDKTDNCFEGGCLCTKIRYKVAAVPILIEYCHCRTCRTGVGAPLVAWAAFQQSEFAVMTGKPKQYRSSQTVIRTFCNTCGTSLTLADERFPSEIYVSLASLDEPELLPPEFHIWRSHRISWLETADKLPRYVQFKSDGLIEE